MDEAIAYADRNGKQRPGALSNNFSLAEMLEPIWAGCVAASDDDWKDWLKARQMPNFAWSSQGRGFFTDRAGRDKRTTRNWCGSGTRKGISAAATGRSSWRGKLGKSPIHVALAYVLAQPFPSIPLIGPRTLGELEDSLKALDITLTPDQVKWLEAG